MSEWKTWRDSLEEGKNPCYKCQKKGDDKSGDNFHWYGEDDGGHCYFCEYTIPSKEYRSEDYEEEEWSIDVMAKTFSLAQFNKLRSNCSTDPRNYRGLKKKVCELYLVQHEYDQETGELVNQYYPTTKDYQLSGVKVRETPKTFFAMGTVGKECELFGQWKFRNSNSKFVVITGGEIDCLSAFQMLNTNSDYEDIPVVSPTTGETSASKQLQAQYEWFNRFDKIVLCFDNDPAGNEATEKAVKVLPKGKVHILKMNFKDPNEYLEAKKQKEFVNGFWRAEKYTPNGILGSGSLMGKIKDYVTIEKIPLPPFMFKLQGLMAGGIPLGVPVTIASASGTGKTTLVDEMSYFWYFNCPHKIGVVTLEADSAQYGINILSRHLNKKINLIEDPQEKIAFLEQPDVQEASERLFFDDEGNNRFYIVEERDGDLESVKELISNLIISCDCKVIVLDPVSDILEGCTNEEQQKFFKWMKGMIKSHLVSFINIAHVRKSGGGQKANSTGADLHEEDIFGSSSLFKSSACNLLFMRNKEAEDEIDRNTTRMKASKIRWTGRTSPVAGEYYYDIETHRVYDKDWYAENIGFGDIKPKPKKTEKKISKPSKVTKEE